jgi:hypothetical protein
MSGVLKQIQAELQQFLLNPQCEPADLIDETAQMTRGTRLNIYANAYRLRMVEALATDYQALKLYLGDEAFETLVLAYIEAHPSRYFSLRWVGGKLAEFIQTTAPYREHLDLYELAQFEWVLCYAFDARDSVPLRADALVRLLPEQWSELSLRFAPSLQVLALHTNAPQLWQALQAEQAPPAVTGAAVAQAWLIWRQQLKLMFRPTDALELIALEQFRDGATFDTVCALLAKHLPEAQVPVRAVGFLQQWLQDELLVDKLLGERLDESKASP